MGVASTRTLSEKLNHLFETVHPAGRRSVQQ